jgi:hypothetical protein
VSRGKRAIVRSKYAKELIECRFECCKLPDVTLKSKNSKGRDKVTIWKFIKRICLILTNKVETNGSMTVGTFALLTAMTFKIIAIIGFALFCIGGYYVVVNAIDWEWNNTVRIASNIFALVLIVMILLFVGGYSVIIWGASNEVEKETDKNFVVSVFSGLVSFAALIVALVALVKE